MTTKRWALRSFAMLLLTAGIGLFAATPALAMHISEGILPFGRIFGMGRKAGWLLLCALFLLTLARASLSASDAKTKWQGVDESVVEKVAHEHGRETHPPLINTDQGDLLLFVFLMAGAVGGFAAGYYWRSLTQQKEANSRNGGG